MPSISIVNRVFRSTHDQEHDWIGEGIYADIWSAKEWVRAEFVEWCQELDEDYIPGVLEWIPIGQYFWHLYEDNAHTGVVIRQEAVHKVKP